MQTCRVHDTMFHHLMLKKATFAWPLVHRDLVTCECLSQLGLASRMSAFCGHFGTLKHTH
jgi:hypothetical protein